MLSIKYKELLSRLKTNSWVSQAQVAEVEKKRKDDEYTEEYAYKLLQTLERTPPINIFPEKIENDWEELANAISEAENRIKRTTKFQLILGLCILPLFVTIVISLGIIGWFKNDISSSFLIILGGTLSALVAYSFFVMRTQQQASIAIERLAEKRLAILFLRIAASSEQNHLNAEQLISAGFKMFMNHHAPDTIPLSSQDLAASMTK